MTSDAMTKKSARCLVAIEEIRERWTEETDLGWVITKKWKQEIQSWF
jgi:hypothetical protein